MRYFHSIAVVVSLLLSSIWMSGTCAAQMSFSVYTAPSINSDGTRVIVNSTVYDNSSGCNHTSYYTTAQIYSATQRYSSNRVSGLAATTSLPISGEWGNYQISTSGTYYCGCSSMNSGFGGGQNIRIGRPTSLRTISDQYTWRNYNDYQRRRIYEVVDETGIALQVSGYPVWESYSTYSINTCQIPQPAMGVDVNTNNQGRFDDRYFMQNANGCKPSGKTCTSTATQTIRVSGFPIRTNTVSYHCDSVDVQP